MVGTFRGCLENRGISRQQLEGSPWDKRKVSRRFSDMVIFQGKVGAFWWLRGHVRENLDIGEGHM